MKFHYKLLTDTIKLFEIIRIKRKNFCNARHLNNNRFPGSHVPIWRRRIRMRAVAGKGKWAEAKQRIEIRGEKIEGRVDIPVSFSHARVRHTDLAYKTGTSGSLS